MYLGLVVGSMSSLQMVELVKLLHTGLFCSVVDSVLIQTIIVCTRLVFKNCVNLVVLGHTSTWF